MTSRELLKANELRSTSTREDILELFLRTPHALSQADIEREFSHSLDRVTIYRTLKTFVEKGVLHKVLDDTGSPKFAPCADTCESPNHRHDHLHFKCMRCQQTSCLDVHLPEIALPAGYKLFDMSYLAHGICNNCSR